MPVTMPIQYTSTRSMTLADTSQTLSAYITRFGAAVVYQAHAGHYETLGAKTLWDAIRAADNRSGRSVEVLGYGDKTVGAHYVAQPAAAAVEDATTARRAKP
jgi:hypothetical protein